MISSVLSACAENVIVDRFTNSVSAVNLLEVIAPESFPIVLARVFFLFIVTREENDPPTVDGTLILRHGETELFSAQRSIDFQGMLRNRLVINLQGVVVPSPGMLHATLEVNKTIVGRWDVPCEARPSQIKLLLQETRPE